MKIIVWSRSTLPQSLDEEYNYASSLARSYLKKESVNVVADGTVVLLSMANLVCQVSV